MGEKGDDSAGSVLTQVYGGYGGEPLPSVQQGPDELMTQVMGLGRRTAVPRQAGSR